MTWNVAMQTATPTAKRPGNAPAQPDPPTNPEAAAAPAPAAEKPSAPALTTTQTNRAAEWAQKTATPTATENFWRDLSANPQQRLAPEVFEALRKTDWNDPEAVRRLTETLVGYAKQHPDPFSILVEITLKLHQLRAETRAPERRAVVEGMGDVVARAFQRLRDAEGQLAGYKAQHRRAQLDAIYANLKNLLGYFPPKVADFPGRGTAFEAEMRRKAEQEAHLNAQNRLEKALYGPERERGPAGLFAQNAANPEAKTAAAPTPPQTITWTLLRDALSGHEQAFADCTLDGLRRDFPQIREQFRAENPDANLGRYLAEITKFRHNPTVQINKEEAAVVKPKLQMLGGLMEKLDEKEREELRKTLKKRLTKIFGADPDVLKEIKKDYKRYIGEWTTD